MGFNELNLTGPVGQASHEDIDAHLLAASLGGRNIDRELGRIKSFRVSGADYQLDDDSIFHFRVRGLDDSPQLPEAQAIDSQLASKVGHGTLLTLW